MYINPKESFQREGVSSRSCFGTAEDILAASYRLFEILELSEKTGQQGQTLPWEGWSMGSVGLCLSAEAGGHTQRGQDTAPAHS